MKGKEHGKMLDYRHPGFKDYTIQKKQNIWESWRTISKSCLAMSKPCESPGDHILDLLHVRVPTHDSRMNAWRIHNYFVDILRKHNSSLRIHK